METGGGSATRSPGRAGRQAPPGEACCWSKLTGRSAAGMGDPPGTDQTGETGHKRKCKTHDFNNHYLTAWNQLLVWNKACFCILIQCKTVSKKDRSNNFSLNKKGDGDLGWASKGHLRLPAATLAPPGPGSLWWSYRLDQGWSEPRRSPAGWSLSLLSREQELRPPLWEKHDRSWLQFVRLTPATDGFICNKIYSHPFPSLFVSMANRMCSLTCRYTGQPGKPWSGSPSRESASWKPLVCSTSGRYCATGHYRPPPAWSGCPAECLTWE